MLYERFSHSGQYLDTADVDPLLARRVTGRLITGRAAAAGALSGLWAGLLTGILFGLFTGVNTWIAMLVAGVGLGVLCGATLAIAAHLAVRSQGGLGSLRGLSARHDDVTAHEFGAMRARNALGQAGLVPPDTPAA
jgi:hypothetical protein